MKKDNKGISMTQRLISTTGQKNVKFTNWDTNTQYRPGDMVVYNSNVYTTAVDIPEGTPWGPEWTAAVNGGASQLTGLTDVSDSLTTNIQVGQQLQWDGTQWTKGWTQILQTSDTSLNNNYGIVLKSALAAVAHAQMDGGDNFLYNPSTKTVTLQGETITSTKIQSWDSAASGGSVPTAGLITGTGAQDYQVATTDPTTKSDGSTALTEGDLWYDSSSADLKIWNADAGDWVLVINSVPPSIINGMSSVQAHPTHVFFAAAGVATMSLTANGLELRGFTETVSTPFFNTTLLPNLGISTIQRFTATANFTFNGFTSPVAGQSATIIITQDATGSRLMTSTMKFSGGLKTLSTAPGAIDIISAFYDGTTYYASLTQGYV